ncbi:palmitoyltransferase app [Culicoides brevitarsis]|uniref:palmitoyltransferase app n=1 Tax=Culicoides brevitarsis TaxID=469753 RepID=UPI00307B18DA
MTRNSKVTRRWEVFPGRNKFYCNGYLMTAPNTTVFCLTVFLITGTSGLFFAFDCPFLAQTITPAIPIVGGILYVFVMIALFRTSFSDPGVIPRASAEEAAEIEKQIEVPNSLNSPTYRPPPRVKEVYVKGQVVKLKYCFTCKIFRPPRASHCSLCDNCVERFDHHCPWVGNCVGKRNYRFFYMFIVSLAFLAVFIFSCAMTHIILLTKANEPVVTVIKETPTSVIVATICFFSVWSVIGLAGFHTYLTSSDQTTNEDIKGSFSSKNGQQSVNPYSHGNICLNCFHILCGPISPSLINRRGIVTDDERLQIECDSKCAAQSQVPMLVQPLSNNKFGIPNVHGAVNDINKPYNNLEIDPSLNNAAGVYRQRSYDNLQSNDNSGSVIALVENEQPLSTSSTSIQQRLKQIGPPPPPLPPLTPTDESLNSPELVVSSNDSNSLSLAIDNSVQIHHPASSRSLLRQNFTENLYNNVLPVNGSSRLQPMPGPLKPQLMALELIKNDPSLHVYSNIEEKMHESIDIFLKSGPTSRYGGGGVVNPDTHEVMEMDDDLDRNDVEEDDVMTVSDHEDHESSFIQTRPTSSPEFITLHPITNSSLSNINNNNTSTSSSSVTTQIDVTSTHHLSGFTPVTGTTKFQPSTMALQSPSNLLCNNNATNSISTSSSVGNASDLDGASSIGNNSQSCLVKPAAIV